MSDRKGDPLKPLSGEMASFAVEDIAHDVDSVFEASKSRKKSKKTKKERKDKSKAKRAADILLQDGCHATLTQMHKSKKRKKSEKKKTKLEHDFQLLPHIKKPKSENQHKRLSSTHTGITQDAHQIQSVICISPDLEPNHSRKTGCLKRVTEDDRSKKRVVFNLPPEPSQAATTNDEPTTLPRPISSGNMSQGKQLVEENILESQTPAEEINSQDLFITQKSFTEPNVNLSSSASCNDVTIISLQEERSCRLTVEASTQTENFFTCPAFANCLRFQQKISTSTEEPMDLSMPKSARKMQCPNLPAKHPVAYCMNQTERKLSDTSSDDGDVVPKTKADFSQLKVVQTRLNESFFFKVKGYDSPKPVCPLMKLTQNAEMKTKK